MSAITTTMHNNKANATTKQKLRLVSKNSKSQFLVQKLFENHLKNDAIQHGSVLNVKINKYL